MKNLLNIDQDAFNILFPFSFVLNEKLGIEIIGKSIKKITESHIGDPIKDVFAFVRPRNAEFKFESIKSFSSQIFILRLINDDRDILIRGAFYPFENRLLFVGSPWVTSPDSLNKLGLKLVDFALHDPVTDMLQVMKVNEVAANDVKLLNSQLEKSENRYRELVELGSDIIYTFDPNGHITFVNEIALRILQFNKEHLLGKHFTHLLPEHIHDLAKEKFKNMVHDHIDEAQEEIQMIKGEGSILWVNQHLKLVYNDQDQLVEIRSFSRDIHARKTVEKELILAEQRLRNLIANLQSGILLESESRKVVLTNQKFCDLFLIPASPEMLVGGDCNDAAHASKGLFKDPEGFIQSIDRALKAKKIVVGEEFHTTNGRILERDFIPVISGDNYLGHLWQYHDLTEKKKIQQNLISARKEAEVAREAEQQFLTHISHEIRTPLNAIIGMSQLLEDTNPNPDQRQYLNILQSSADLLLNLINDILDVAKIEAGKLEKFESKFDLNKLLQHFRQTFTLQLKTKPIKIEVDNIKELENYVIGDETLLSQIMFNVVGNAVKFTEKGYIRISADLLEQDKDIIWVQFAVKDTGVGISQDKIEIIFERFQQANEEISVKYGGTGLGLSITKKLIEFLGGDLSVQSQLGEGSTFTWKIPFHDSHEKIQHQKSLIASNHGDILSGLRILVAEDNTMNMFYVRKVLQKHHANPTFVNTGREAVKAANQTHFDVILMDIQMPVMDGHTATKIIRSESKLNASTPIIALTASSHKEQVEQAMKSGMNDFLSKPFTPKHLIDRILNLVEDGMIQTIDPKETQALLTNPIDNQFLKEYYNDDRDYAKLMIKTFCETTLEELDQLKEAIEQNNFELAANLAHKFKPSFAMIGLPLLTRKMQELEDTCKSNSQDAIKLFVQFNEELQNLMPLVNQAFDKLIRHA